MTGKLLDLLLTSRAVLDVARRRIFYLVASRASTYAYANLIDEIEDELARAQDDLATAHAKIAELLQMPLNIPPRSESSVDPLEKGLTSQNEKITAPAGHYEISTHDGQGFSISYLGYHVYRAEDRSILSIGEAVAAVINFRDRS